MSGLTAKMSRLLETAKLLPELEQRKVSAILGACVADAAARPLHWVYDMSELKKYLRSKVGNSDSERSVDRNENPEFFPENRSPYYKLPTGENSCYFDIAKSVLMTLRNENGVYDYNAICSGFKENFFVKKDYDMKKRQEYMQRRAHGLDLTPIDGKWLSGSLIEFLQNFNLNKNPYGGSHIKETDGFCASLPLVVLDAGKPELYPRVKEVVQTLSTWPTAVSHGQVAARIVEQFILNEVSDPISSVMGSIEKEFPDVHRSLKNVEANLDQDHIFAVGCVFGRPCYNPGSFQGALHSLLTSDNFGDAVRKTIKAGGCSCSRSFFIGSCAGAKYGLDGIPQDWIAKSIQAEEVLEAAIHIVTSNQK